MRSLWLTVPRMIKSSRKVYWCCKGRSGPSIKRESATIVDETRRSYRAIEDIKRGSIRSETNGLELLTRLPRSVRACESRGHSAPVTFCLATSARNSARPMRNARLKAGSFVTWQRGHKGALDKETAFQPLLSSFLFFFLLSVTRRKMSAIIWKDCFSFWNKRYLYA